jgi:hypothetical protein
MSKYQQKPHPLPEPKEEFPLPELPANPWKPLG